MKLATLASGTTLVCGFGREGRALERAVLARVPGADCRVVCDVRPDAAPARWPLHVGDLDSLAAGGWRPDRVLRSPGVPVDEPLLARWRELGVEVLCISSLWFGERPDARVIAVTGSKGKSTTASLIHHLLAADAEAALGGNIGVALLDLLDTRADWFVVELSSYQLADLRGHAAIGVITRLFPEHQDWHGGIEPYYAAKLRLFELLDGGPLWINAGDPVLRARVAGRPGVRPANLPAGLHARPDGIFRGPERIVPAERIPLRGRHNFDNLVLALEVVESIRGTLPEPARRLAGFRALAHRLQTLPAPDRREWINDSIATTPHATLAALEAVAGALVLIVGGKERGADWQAVIAHCRRRALAGLVGLPDNGAAVVARFIAAEAIAPQRTAVVDDIAAAVDAAARLAGREGVVLLSPGAPSFPHFRDFEDRGRQFATALGQRR